MKLGPVTKIDKRKTMMLKNFDDDVVSAYYHAIIIFPIMVHLEQSGTQIPGVRSIIFYIFINSSFLSYRNWKQN